MSNYKEYLKNKVRENVQLKDNVLFYSWLKEIGIQVTKLREQKGYRQEDLAQRMNVSQSVIARLEAGHNMTCSTLWKLSNTLKLELSIFGASNFLEHKKFSSFMGHTNTNPNGFCTTISISTFNYNFTISNPIPNAERYYDTVRY